MTALLWTLAMLIDVGPALGVLILIYLVGWAVVFHANWLHAYRRRLTTLDDEGFHSYRRYR